ncbi:hypothetical protein BDP27DRAFT_1183322, partial [Rhodocollybia butyracea]
TSGYIGRDRVEGSPEDETYTLEQLVGPNSRYNFRLVPANAPETLLLVDSSQRTFGGRMPPPKDDPTFADAAGQAADLLEQYRPLFFGETPPPAHRRGVDFGVQAFGLSFGGGQEEPGRIYHAEAELKLLEQLRTAKCMIRLAQHASRCFEYWAPDLYLFFASYMGTLFSLFPHLDFNFVGSIFACCTLNFGPKTITIEHLDHMNYIFGWCAVTALGSFNFRKGGHMILWDLGLVLEVPPGWTMLIPSAYLRHSNTLIGSGEKRFSITQYTAGGLIRVLEDGGKARSKMGKAERREAEEAQRARINEGLNLYSKLSD